MSKKHNFKVRAKGRRRHIPGQMNKTEARYADHLELMLKSGEILWYKFEAMTFKLADMCRYTPDFAVLFVDGTFELHEVKGGYIRDDAKVKIKVAAETFPFNFKFCIQARVNDPWAIEDI
jgi:hypothetical protein